MHSLITSFVIVLSGLISMLSLPALAEGSADSTAEGSAATDAYAEAQATLEAGNFAAALPMLVGLSKAEPGNAKVWTLLGYSYRQLGQIADSNAAYLQALAIAPDRQGELFLPDPQVQTAGVDLARLQA